MKIFDFLRYQIMLMKPDEGDAGGASGGDGGDSGAGDAGGDDGAGDAGADKGGAGDAGAGGDKSGQDGAGDKAGADKTGAAGAGDDKAGDKSKDGKDGKPADKKADAKDDTKGKWSPTWREDWAAGDPKKLAELKRYNSPKEVSDALVAAKEKIRTMTGSEPLPKNATPEQIKEYREKNGIPETPEKYLEALPDGLVLGEEDKKGAEPYLKEMHDMNVPPAIVAKGLAAYQARQAAQTQLIEQQDVEQRESAINELREEWGPDYQANINAMHNMLKSQFPAEIQEELLNARLGNGRALLNDSQIIRALSKIGREIDPTGTPTPGTGFDKIETIESQIKDYEGRMSKDRTAWFKDTKSQEHLRQLYDARERYKARAK